MVFVSIWRRRGRATLAAGCRPKKRRSLAKSRRWLWSWISEPWPRRGTSGVYLLGRSYPGWLWRQWNGRYRDDVRAFIRGDADKMAALMGRLYGVMTYFLTARAMYTGPIRASISSPRGWFLSLRSGRNLVAYSHKRNAVNGHDNTNGSDNNISWNCGWEGDACAPAEVLALRRQQVKNFFVC